MDWSRRSLWSYRSVTISKRELHLTVNSFSATISQKENYWRFTECTRVRSIRYTAICMPSTTTKSEVHWQKIYMRITFVLKRTDVEDEPFLHRLSKPSLTHCYLIVLSLETRRFCNVSSFKSSFDDVLVLELRSLHESVFLRHSLSFFHTHSASEKNVVEIGHRR
jgi:hypothetical protein